MPSAASTFPRRIRSTGGRILRRARLLPPAAVSPATMTAALQRAIKTGLNPSTIIDVGAADGTPALSNSFPESKHLLVEPLLEFKSKLLQVQARLSDCELVFAAAGAQSGSAVLNVHPDLYGSSLHKEQEDSDVNGYERTVPVVTLDELCREKHTRGPYLIKVDTQGSEISVLQGAHGILQEADYVILELSLFNFFQGGVGFSESLQFMRDHGFVVYDIFDQLYRPLDGALSQVDVAFVKDDSVFRQYHYYATPEQRGLQNAELRANLR